MLEEFLTVQGTVPRDFALERGVIENYDFWLKSREFFTKSALKYQCKPNAAYFSGISKIFKIVKFEFISKSPHFRVCFLQI